MSRAALLIISLALVLGCQAPKGTYEVKADSKPNPALIALDGRELGRTPSTILLPGPDDISRVRAEFQGKSPVEQRIRFLPDGKVELFFLFGEERSDMAKALGLAKVLVFEYAAGLTFDVNKAELKATTLPLLQRQATLLNAAFKDIAVHVCGHTDSTGSQEQNLELSLQRAKAVMAYLESQGVKKERLRPQGFAAAYPLASNATDEGRAMNRRTEIVLGQ